MKKITLTILIGLILTTHSTNVGLTIAEETKIREQIEFKLVQEELERKRLEEAKRIEEENLRKEQERAAEEKRMASVGFDSENLLSLSNITSNEMYEILKGTGLEDVAQALIDAERQYGVNAIIIAALAAEESGWGNSDRAINQNNLTGYAVYHHLSRGGEFSSRGESVLSTAKLLRESYLEESGQYHNGVSLRAVNIKYSANKKWAENIKSISEGLVNKYTDMFR